MSQPNLEKILVVPTKALWEHVLYFHGAQMGSLKSLAPLFGLHLQHAVRGAAETDLSLKQPIPYMLLCAQTGRSPRPSDQVWLLQYRRNKGGESRLDDKWSIGFGGHLMAEDANYIRGATRELHEELTFTRGLQPVPPETVIGFLNEDQTPVGKVHFGVVHLLELPMDALLSVNSNDTAVADLQAVTLTELLSEASFNRLEPWSQLALQLLRGILTVSGQLRSL